MHNSISDFLLDIIQNAIEADSADIEVVIEDREDVFTCCIADDGRGMSAEVLGRIRDPFYTDGKKHAGRRVGLGIPFLEQTAEMAGGSVDITSEEGRGTVVRFSFAADHIDTPPAGNIPSAIAAAMTYPGEFELSVTCRVVRRSQSDEYRLSRSELIEALGELHSGQSQALLRRYIISLDESLESLRLSR